MSEHDADAMLERMASAAGDDRDYIALLEDAFRERLAVNVGLIAENAELRRRVQPS